jgi:S1-C subfamily serine protease
MWLSNWLKAAAVAVLAVALAAADLPGARAAVTPRDPAPPRVVPPRTVRGLLILRVQPGGPAWDAGLEEGDLILSINGRPVYTLGDLRVAVRAAGWRARVTAVDYRTGERVTRIVYPRYGTIAVGVQPWEQDDDWPAPWSRPRPGPRRGPWIF